MVGRRVIVSAVAIFFSCASNLHMFAVKFQITSLPATSNHGHRMHDINRRLEVVIEAVSADICVFLKFQILRERLQLCHQSQWGSFLASHTLCS